MKEIEISAEEARDLQQMKNTESIVAYVYDNLHTRLQRVPSRYERGQAE